MSRRSWPVRAGRLIQRLPLEFLRFLEAPVVRFRSRDGDPVHALILLALPRSGSTLTYQVLTHGLESMYLSNLGNLLYKLPLLGGGLTRWRCARYGSKFRSEAGFVPGLCGPAEGLRYWSYWLGSGLDERATDSAGTPPDPARAAYLRRVLSLLGRPGRPVITGYLGHTLMVERLQQVFPDALLIRLHREKIANALSILRCRRQSRGGWFSLFPRESSPDVGRGVHAEVASQVYWLNRRLDAADRGDRTLHLAYENICRRPREELERVIAFAGARGFDLRPARPLPERFDPGGPRADEVDDLKKLTSEMERLESRFGALGSPRG